MEEYVKPAPMTKKYLTPGVIILIVLALNGLAFLAARFLFGHAPLVDPADPVTYTFPAR